MTDINKTLDERQQTHGSFESHARISQALKDAMQLGKFAQLDDTQREALEMIVHKIARILNGDPNHRDSWHDIVKSYRSNPEYLVPNAGRCPHTER